MRFAAKAVGMLVTTGAIWVFGRVKGTRTYGSDALVRRRHARFARFGAQSVKKEVSL